MGAHALLIGVSRFDDPKLTRLSAPESDVEALARVLKDPSRAAFDSVETCLDQDLLTIRNQLSMLLHGRTPSDMVLLYYSGHGILAAGQRLFLATGQSLFDRPEAASLAANEVRDMLDYSRAGRIVVILDCCHSGAFADRAKAAVTPAVMEGTFGAGEGAEGHYVLTATSALQFAYDAAGALISGKSPGLSRFTSWLVDGLTTGDAAPGEEWITLDALYEYLCRRARTEASGMAPQRFVKRGSGVMAISRNPAAGPPALPDAVLAKLDSTDWQTRLAAVNELGVLARQARMTALVRKTLLARVGNERDVEVQEAMFALLPRRGQPEGRSEAPLPKATEDNAAARIPATPPVQPQSPAGFDWLMLLAAFLVLFHPWIRNALLALVARVGSKQARKLEEAIARVRGDEQPQAQRRTETSEPAQLQWRGTPASKDTKEHSVSVDSIRPVPSGKTSYALFAIALLDVFAVLGVRNYSGYWVVAALIWGAVQIAFPLCTLALDFWHLRMLPSREARVSSGLVAGAGALVVALTMSAAAGVPSVRAALPEWLARGLAIGQDEYRFIRFAGYSTELQQEELSSLAQLKKDPPWRICLVKAVAAPEELKGKEIAFRQDQARAVKAELERLAVAEEVVIEQYGDTDPDPYIVVRCSLTG